MASTRYVLQEFDSDSENWESYSEQLRQYFATNRTPEDKKVSVLLAALSPPVYKMLRDSCRPELPQVKSYSQLSKLLGMHYSQRASVFKKRVKFHEAEQARNEDVYAWLARVMNLAGSCEFEEQLYTMLRDKFVSGLADKRMASSLNEENETVTLGRVVDLAVEMEEKIEADVRVKSLTPVHRLMPEKHEAQASEISRNKTEMLNMPNEVLIKIFLHLNARERVLLGNTCNRFYSLVFEDKKLLRYLDFSKNGYLASVSDIQHYFSNEITCKHILGVNVKHVDCIKPGPMLDTSIRNAMNLVDINIHGTAFKDIWHLGSFLNPLLYVRKLSFDWQLDEENSLLCHQLLLKPFGRLTDLSVKVPPALLEKFLFSLQLCQELKNLCIQVEPPHYDYPDIATGQFRELRKLEIVRFNGHWLRKIRERVVSMLPEPEKWTDFQMGTPNIPFDFYLEKNVEVCKELAGSEWMKIIPSAEWKHLNLGWALFPELLLQAVLEITHENVPVKLCCLTTFDIGHRCLMKVEEAKRLLKDPTFQISYLYLNHGIERSCDIHLIASAFPGLTELVLSDVVSSQESTRNGPHSKRRLRRKTDMLTHEQNNLLMLDSSFKMLVENTPKMKHLSMRGSPDDISGICWDSGAMYIISGWKSLESLTLWNILINDGEFLIEIGRRCKHLQKLDLLDSAEDSCYKEGLLQMLSHCRNLRNFALEANVGQMSDVFTVLKRNKHLEDVRAISLGCENTTGNLISSVEQLLQSCPRLNTFSCKIDYISETDCDELTSAVRRWRGKFSRLNLQIQVVFVKQDSSTRQIGKIYMDRPDFGPFQDMWTGN